MVTVHSGGGIQGAGALRKSDRTVSRLVVITRGLIRNRSDGWLDLLHDTLRGVNGYLQCLSLDERGFAAIESMLESFIVDSSIPCMRSFSLIQIFWMPSLTKQFH